MLYLVTVVLARNRITKEVYEGVVFSYITTYAESAGTTVIFTRLLVRSYLVYMLCYPKFVIIEPNLPQFNTGGLSALSKNYNWHIV